MTHLTRGNDSFFQITRWENGNIKKMQRKDGTWNYFDRERELFTNFHKVKIYQYQ